MRRWMTMGALAVALFLPACAVNEDTTADGERQLEVRRATETETRAEVREETGAIGREANEEIGDADRATDATQREIAEESRQAGQWTAEQSANAKREAQEELADAKAKMKELETRTDAEAVEARRELGERVDKLQKELAEFGDAAGDALSSAGAELMDGLRDLRDYLSRIDVDVTVRDEPDSN